MLCRSFFFSFLADAQLCTHLQRGETWFFCRLVELSFVTLTHFLSVEISVHLVLIFKTAKFSRE